MLFRAGACGIGILDRRPDISYRRCFACSATESHLGHERPSPTERVAGATNLSRYNDRRINRDRRLHTLCDAGLCQLLRGGRVTVRVTSLRGAGAGEYYVSEVGSYYLAAEEPRGRWFGDGAARL